MNGMYSVAVSTLLLAFILIWISWVVLSYITWRTHFANRFRRRECQCPSHYARPYLVPLSLRHENKKKQVSQRSSSSSRCPMSTMVHKTVPPLSDDNRVETINFKKSSCSGKAERKEEIKKRADRLDMDHLYVSLWDYLWGAHVVGVPALIMLITGGLELLCTEILFYYGILSPTSEDDIDTMIARLLLETSAAIYLVNAENIDPETNELMYQFSFPNCPVILNNITNDDTRCEQHSYDFTVFLTMETRQFVGARLGNDDDDVGDSSISLNRSDCLLLLMHTLCGVVHPKIHAYANWGFDPDFKSHNANNSSRETKFIHRCAVVTAVYNHFGYNNSPQIFSILCGTDAGQSLKKVFDISMPVPPHPHSESIRVLAPISPFVSFIMKLQTPFVRLFRNYQQQKTKEGNNNDNNNNDSKQIFPSSMSGESYFLGTVMHSLDHIQVSHNINRFQFACLPVSKRFRSCHKIQKVVRFMMVDDLHSSIDYFVPRYFRDAPTEFHRKVYIMAQSINTYFADEIQTCIIK